MDIYEEILRLEYSKELFDRDMNSYVKEYIEILKSKKEGNN